MNGLRNARSNCSDQCGGFSREASFRPSRCRRARICSASSPPGWLCSASSSAAVSRNAWATVDATATSRREGLAHRERPDNA